MKVGSRYPLYFAVPALLLYGTFFIIPSLSGIVYSFTDWSSYSDEVNFVGLKNFVKLFSPGENYLGYFGNTFLFTGCHDRPQDSLRARRWRCCSTKASSDSSTSTGC